MVGATNPAPGERPVGVQRAHWRIPKDLFQRGWDTKTLLLACYLLGCPIRTMEGLFWLPKAVMASALKWTEEELAEPFDRLFREGFLVYDDELEIVFLTEALTVQNTANDNMRIHSIRLLKTVQPTPLFDALLAVAADFDPKLAQKMLRDMPERFTERSDQWSTQ